MSSSVVVVEDSLLLVKQFRRTLERHGYVVHESTSPITAIDMIDEIRPAAVILDFMLSGNNAMTLLHELISHDDLAKIPIIMVTNVADQLPVATMKAYNVSQILDKTTMLPEDIATAVKRVV